MVVAIKWKCVKNPEGVGKNVHHCVCLVWVGLTVHMAIPRLDPFLASLTCSLTRVYTCSPIGPAVSITWSTRGLRVARAWKLGTGWMEIRIKRGKYIHGADDTSIATIRRASSQVTETVAAARDEKLKTGRGKKKLQVPWGLVRLRSWHKKQTR